MRKRASVAKLRSEAVVVTETRASLRDVAFDGIDQCDRVPVAKQPFGVDSPAASDIEYAERPFREEPANDLLGTDELQLVEPRPDASILIPLP